MTIDEAIKVLTQFVEYREQMDWLTYIKASKLGIEALKRIREGRRKGYDYFAHQLPGETEE